ncbi:MAG TPA: BPL-N domain-containing protein [Chlamydiales bacterium]|nr:BPL-N domain-containing protein [Chlamydiales bacterium]
MPSSTKKIAIYTDEGTSAEGITVLARRLQGYKPLFITAKDISSRFLSTLSLLIIPGGRDIPYHEKISGTKAQNIIQFVQDGGSYLGICAGAYFASSEFEFDKGASLEILAKRELSFFPGKAIGPAFGPNTFRYDSKKGMKATLVHSPLLTSPIYSIYHGGCYFEKAHESPGINLLGSYSEIAGSPPAIISRQIGSGLALLSGVHLEYSANDLPKGPLAKKLQSTDKEREEFFQMLIRKLVKSQ